MEITLMLAPCNQHIVDALELSRQLIILADQGEAASQDDSCTVLYGVIRDCAYKIRQQAERERERHVAKGLWVDDDMEQPQEPMAATG